MNTINELKHIIAGEDFQFNEHIVIHNPTLREIYDLGEKEYFQIIQTFTIRPYDAMVFLYDLGINYDEIDDFDFFAQHLIGIYKSPMTNEDDSILRGTRLLFGDFDFSKFILTKNVDNDMLCLYHEELDFVIDKVVYKKLLSAIRKLNNMAEETEYKPPGNGVARKFIVEKMRRRMKKEQKKEFKSQLSNFVSALVNYDGFKYDYSTVFDLKISQFWDAFSRVNKYMNYNYTMQGVYAGTVDYSKISDKESISWISETTK